jgi:hypothetical protein
MATRVVKRVSPVKEDDKELQELRNGLPSRYHKYLDELDAEDQGIYLRHKDNYRTAVKDLWADIKLALDLHSRMSEFQLDGGGREDVYGKKLIKNLSVLFEISESRIYDAMRFVSIFGEVKALDIARTVEREHLSITLTHFRQLNRLSSDDFKGEREEILKEMYEGKLVTVKDVEARVDSVLGSTRQMVTTIDPVAVELSTPHDYEVAEDEPDGDDEKSNDSSGSRLKFKVSRPSVPGLKTLTDILEYVTLSGNAQAKQWSELSAKLDQWRADMELESLKTVDASVGIQAINELREECNVIKSVLLAIEEICTVITTSQQEVSSTRRKFVTSNLEKVA